MLYPQLDSVLRAYSPSRFVLAFSGGMDSRVLLHLLARYQQVHPEVTCQAVHVHHGLSANADTWAAQCEAWAQEAGMACVIEHVTLLTGSGESIEQLARDARYQALNKHVDANTVLLTAQHADDQLETFLLALKRGSGPAGLSAMPAYIAFGAGLHCRPLLGVSRAEIEQYADTHQLEWVEDESNQDERYDRNFLRHQVTPLLTARWPGIRKAVARSARLCAEQERLLEDLLAAQLAQAVQPDGSLAVTALGSERQAKA
ncbi:tRNA(Ile)-lysidine synthetase [Photobacterium aphoticum]|uniref:tRNA(Ile)-lysidine synthase n=1 Tax=Photobacterium aphoticum TaxID=754436 RepID=A0A090R0J4_9GAMM|nr:tRNA(Ile)-lysidine synthetase [Photobacterium aphoticum]